MGVPRKHDEAMIALARANAELVEGLGRVDDGNHRRPGRHLTQRARPGAFPVHARDPEAASADALERPRLVVEQGDAELGVEGPDVACGRAPVLPIAGYRPDTQARPRGDERSEHRARAVEIAAVDHVTGQDHEIRLRFSDDGDRGALHDAKPRGVQIADHGHTNGRL